jgi:hypothetical protein
MLLKDKWLPNERTNLVLPARYQIMDRLQEGHTRFANSGALNWSHISYIFLGEKYLNDLFSGISIFLNLSEQIDVVNISVIVFSVH